MSRETVCKLRLAWGEQLVLFFCVAAADMEGDMVAGVVLFVSRDGVQVAVRVGRAAGAIFLCGGYRHGG